MKKRIILVLAFVLLFSNAATYLTTRNVYLKRVVPPSFSQSTDNGSSKGEEFIPFIEAFNIISQRYLEEVTIEDLLNSAIKGMVDGLGDPQTSFLSPSQWEEMMIKIDGSFSGIGIEITSEDGFITIISPIKNTPGERAGLLAGDRIVAVDGEDIFGISTFDAVKLLRGPVGSEVKLVIDRENAAERLNFDIIRGNIILPSVYPQMLDNKIGYIEITTFDEHTGEDFSIALMELENQGMEGLILDLRDNPGGLLSEAVKVAQELLPAGPITHVVNRHGEILSTYNSYGVKKAYPITILVNGASASASEIIAGAFQDSGAGVIVGTKSYGKATVQHLEGLSNKAGIRYTVAKYQTPSGRDIHEVGLEPDVEVEGYDMQLLKAIEVIMEKL